jgi:hypothetical protein
VLVRSGFRNRFSLTTAAGWLTAVARRAVRDEFCRSRVAYRGMHSTFTSENLRTSGRLKTKHDRRTTGILNFLSGYDGWAVDTARVLFYIGKVNESTDFPDDFIHSVGKN